MELRFHKNKINRCHQTERRNSMIPVELLMLENEIRQYGKHHQRDALLNNLQLNQIERSAIACKTYSVGRNLTTVFEECYRPWKGNHHEERPMRRNTCLLKFQMTIPCESHEDIAQNKQQDCINTIYHNYHYQKRVQRYDLASTNANKSLIFICFVEREYLL